MIPFPFRCARAALLACAALLLGSTAMAQTVVVQNAFARPTVQGQTASGAFMSLTAPVAMRLKSVASPVAAVAQVHAMRMEGDIMKMQALDSGLELPAGKTVELKPGGYHIMLMDLKMALKKDSHIPLTLVFVNAQGVESRTELQVPVSASAPALHNHEGH